LLPVDEAAMPLPLFEIMLLLAESFAAAPKADCAAAP
jgi:hypothetical protein